MKGFDYNVFTFLENLIKGFIMASLGKCVGFLFIFVLGIACVSELSKQGLTACSLAAFIGMIVSLIWFDDKVNPVEKV
jgi:hypothetical protein